ASLSNKAPATLRAFSSPPPTRWRTRCAWLGKTTFTTWDPKTCALSMKRPRASRALNSLFLLTVEDAVAKGAWRSPERRPPPLPTACALPHHPSGRSHSFAEAPISSGGSRCGERTLRGHRRLDTCARTSGATGAQSPLGNCKTLL